MHRVPSMALLGAPVMLCLLIAVAGSEDSQGAAAEQSPGVASLVSATLGKNLIYNKAKCKGTPGDQEMIDKGEGVVGDMDCGVGKKETPIWWSGKYNGWLPNKPKSWYEQRAHIWDTVADPGIACPDDLTRGHTCLRESLSLTPAAMQVDSGR